MQSEKNWGFHWKFCLNVISVAFIVEFGGIGGFEVLRQVAILQQFGLNEDLEISVVGSPVPGIGNMPSIHNLSENVLKIIVGHDLVFTQIIVKHICANSQISIVEIITSGPTLSSEFFPSENHRVEITKTEKNSFEFIRFGGFVNSSLIEMSIGSSNICL